MANLRTVKPFFIYIFLIFFLACGVEHNSLNKEIKDGLDMSAHSSRFENPSADLDFGNQITLTVNDSLDY